MLNEQLTEAWLWTKKKYHISIYGEAVSWSGDKPELFYYGDIEFKANWIKEMECRYSDAN